MVSRSKEISTPVSLRRRLIFWPPAPMMTGMTRSLGTVRVSMSSFMLAIMSRILSAALAATSGSATTVMVLLVLSALQASHPNSLRMLSITLSFPSTRTPIAPKRTGGKSILTESLTFPSNTSFSIATPFCNASFLPVTCTKFSPRMASTRKQPDSRFTFSRGQIPPGSSFGGRMRNIRRLGSNGTFSVSAAFADTISSIMARAAFVPFADPLILTTAIPPLLPLPFPLPPVRSTVTTQPVSS
mmetsp:Transcript_63133/g.112634  ORF Transcript_63133/g.112634 Transcript_63133/m.112634 type:complete len:243 (-) Transcript_63133:1692-2420(-)